MLLSTWPPGWEGHLQGLENPGLLCIRAGQACHAVGVIEGIGQQTETIESGYGVRDRDPMRLVLRGAKRGRQAPLQLAAEFQREQTHEDMPAGPTFLANKDRAHFQQAGLHGAKVVFDMREVLIAIVGCLRIEQGRGHIGLEDITARQLQGLLLCCRIAVDREAASVKTYRRPAACTSVTCSANCPSWTTPRLTSVRICASVSAVMYRKRSAANVALPLAFTIPRSPTNTTSAT